MKASSRAALGSEVAAAASRVQPPTLALMLYGSHARGDAEPASDIDLLQLVSTSPGSYAIDSATVVAYTVDQLKRMTRSGSLFAWHLRTEGVILEDPHHLFDAMLSEHPGPDVDGALRRVRELAAVLDVSRREFEENGARILRVARYLLRTAIYARALGAGETSFAIRPATKAAGAARHLPLVIRAATATGWLTVVEYRDALVDVLGAPIAANQYGSLEALAVNCWDSDRQLAGLAIQALSHDAGELDYAMMPAPVL